MAEFEALGFAAGEGVEGLSEFEVAEADFDEGGEEVDDLAVAFGVGGGDAFGVLIEVDGFGDGEVEDVVDGFSLVEEFHGGGFVALSLAARAGDVEVGKELHFDLFEAVAGAAVAAAFAGIEGKEAGGQVARFGVRGVGEELADGIESAEEDGGGGARGAGDGGLVDEFDGREVLGAFEVADGCGVALDFLTKDCSGVHF